jgi:hypothetical protein
VYPSPELLRDLAFSIAAENPAAESSDAGRPLWQYKMTAEPSDAGREFFSQNTGCGITPANLSFIGMLSRPPSLAQLDS